MRKSIYIFLLAGSLVFFASCLKEGNPIPGTAGAKGSAGAPGGNFLTPQTAFVLGSSAPFTGSGSFYSTYWVFSGYNPNITYMFSAYVSRTTSPKTWYKLPYYNIYETGTPPGDELYATLNSDTVKIWYYNSSATPWPDSTMNCQIYIVPNPQ